MIRNNIHRIKIIYVYMCFFMVYLMISIVILNHMTRNILFNHLNRFEGQHILNLTIYTTFISSSIILIIVSIIYTIGFVYFHPTINRTMLRQNLTIFFSTELIAIIEIYSVIKGFLGNLNMISFFHSEFRLIMILVPLIFTALTVIVMAHEQLLIYNSEYNPWWKHYRK